MRFQILTILQPKVNAAGITPEFGVKVLLKILRVDSQNKSVC